MVARGLGRGTGSFEPAAPETPRKTSSGMAICSPLEEHKRVQPLVSAPLKVGAAYYLINRKWYTEWQQWVCHPDTQSPQMRPAQDPSCLTPDRHFSDDAESSPINSAKRVRTLSWTKDRPGQIDNSVLLEPGSTAVIKQNLSELSDYEIVPEDAWNLLYSWYGGGPPIKRRAIETPSGSVQVELHSLQLKVYRSSDTNGEPREVFESKWTLVKTFKVSVCEEMCLDPTKVRLWDYFGNKNHALLDATPDKTLRDCQIIEDNPILLEEQNTDGTWQYKDAEVSGSSLGGAQATSSSSSYTYNFSADVPTVGEPIQRGVVGLQNLGNTCFMNSSIQCLSNIPQLREYFLKDEYKQSLNRQAYKTQGKLAESFAGLLTMMWRDDTTKVAPRNFKWQVGQFAEQFSGYGQQDSMELIEYVVDGLKEDCNKVQGTKPYAECKEADGRSDEEVANEALETYRQRSNSHIDDLFVGLFKSVVRCPESAEKCGRTSVTFDPFLSAKLPLVSQLEQRQKEVKLSVVRDNVPDGSDTSIQVTVKVNKDHSVKALIEAVAREVEGLKVESCVMVEVINHKVQKFFEDSDSVDCIRAEDNLLLCEVEEATAFHKSSKQRWSSSTSYRDSSVAEDSSPSSSSCGAIIHQRQAIARPVTSWCSTSPGLELLGLPLLLSAPHNATVRWLHEQVGRRLRACLHAAGATSEPAWRLFKVDRFSYIAEGTLLDEYNDSRLDLQDSREYFVVEWKEGAPLPPKLRRDELRSNGSLSTYNPSDQEQDLTKLLQLFVEDEQLGSEDTWYCSKCNAHKEAWKKLEFHRTPPVLVLQLKRFQYTKWSRERLNTPVAFPLEGLDLTPFCTASSLKMADAPPAVYDLVALSKHIGSLGGGHYVAYCRSSLDGCWYNFDDGFVRKVSSEEVAADKVGAYVLFYLRRDLRPVSTWGPPSSA